MKYKGRILIIDDREEILVTMKYFLSDHFASIETMKDPNQIPAHLTRNSYDVILLDMNFRAGKSTGNEGLYWLKRILKTDRDATVVLITAFGDVELAVKAMKDGAADFIQKSWDEKKMLSTILAAYRQHQSKKEINKLISQKHNLAQQLQDEHPVCRMYSPPMQEVYQTINKIRETDASVLILGENGTGKEIIAREIHRSSIRGQDIFVAVDLGSLSVNLLESELFGHMKGSFTDAVSDRAGRFEVASGGTLFLDEIGNLTVHLQSKLLSAIQNRQIIKVGSNQPVPIDIRLICATNKPVYDLIEKGEFREDLLYRINTIQIEVPPLRDCKTDIPVLAEHFLRQYSADYRKPGLKISNSAIERLLNHTWPGNIRELKHVIEKAVILSDSSDIGPLDINFSEITSSNSIILNNYNLKEHEKRIIEHVLAKFQGNIRQSAIKLGIDRKTLYLKMRKYGIQKT